MAGAKAFGVQTPNQGEDAVSWQTWSDGAAAVPTIAGDADWGKMHLDLSGEEGRSAVYDHGSAATRTYTLTKNRYGTGSESATLQIRGDTTAFTQDSTALDWEDYTAPISRAWRYVQVRDTTFTYYYVDATLGDDGGAGTRAAPWKTIAKVNGSAFDPGDHILFKRGETWVNECLTVPNSGSASQPIVFGAYGTGANPLIDGSLTVTGWTLDSGAIYRVGSFTAADTTQRALFEDGVRLIRSTSLAGMTGAGCFFLDDPNNILYAWSSDGADPDTHVMKFSNQRDCVDINEKSYLEFDGIDVTMAYLTGYHCRDNGISYITIKNSTCSWVTQRSFDAGGISKVGGGGVRVTWHDNIVFDTCTAHDSIGEGFYMGFGDGLITQNCTSYHCGLDGGSAKGYSGIANAGAGITLIGDTSGGIIRNNTVYDCLNATCNISVEFVAAETDTRPTNSIVYGNYVYRTDAAYNLCLMQDEGQSTLIANNLLCATGGNGHLLRFGLGSISSLGALAYHNTFASTVAIQQCIYGNVGQDCVCKNNIFYTNSGTGYAYVINAGFQTGFVSDYNEWSVPGSSKWGASWYTFANWKTNSGQDANSRNDADPVFVTAISDLNLQTTSPCKNSGADLRATVPLDYDGETRDATPDIGAYEYIA